MFLRCSSPASHVSLPSTNAVIQFVRRVKQPNTQTHFFTSFLQTRSISYNTPNALNPKLHLNTHTHTHTHTPSPSNLYIPYPQTKAFTAPRGSTASANVASFLSSLSAEDYALYRHSGLAPHEFQSLWSALPPLSDEADHLSSTRPHAQTTTASTSSSLSDSTLDGLPWGEWQPLTAAEELSVNHSSSTTSSSISNNQELLRMTQEERGAPTTWSQGSANANGNGNGMNTSSAGGFPATSNLYGNDGIEEREPRMLDCILVRHGESEGNVAYNRSWEGDHSLYTGAFLKRHSSLWRLTDRGKAQAVEAGKWLRENAMEPLPVYRYYVSEYIRAMETAGLMDLPNANWFVEVQLRERDWGTFDIMSQKERVVRFSEETRRRDRDSLFYAPPGGESLVHVLSRVDGILTNFNRQCANRKCVIVCHGEVMWAFRLRFERLSQLTYRELEAASSPYERIHNCQILWYSRRNPFTGEISRFFKWKRSVCPWDLSRSKNEWEEIKRAVHTNDSLLAHCNRVKRIYAHEHSFRAAQSKSANQIAPSTPPAAASASSSKTSFIPTHPPSLETSSPSFAKAAAEAAANSVSNSTNNGSPSGASLSNSYLSQISDTAATSSTPSSIISQLEEDEHLALDYVSSLKQRQSTQAQIDEAASLKIQAMRAQQFADEAADSKGSSSNIYPVVPDSLAHMLSNPSIPPPTSPSPQSRLNQTTLQSQTSTPPATSPNSSFSTQSNTNSGVVNTNSNASNNSISSTLSNASSAVPATPAPSNLFAPSPPSSNNTSPIPPPARSSLAYSMPGFSFLSAHPTVLVLTKTPRYEHEKNSLGLKGADLHAELSKLGFVSDRLVQSYVRHMEGLSQLTLALQQHGMKVIVKHVDAVDRSELNGIDLVISAGGDGTMLKAAALMGCEALLQANAKDSTAIPSSLTNVISPSNGNGAVVQQFKPLPLIGVNTDPQHSAGVLCAFSIEGPHTAERVIEHLRRGHFIWLEKSRIEVTLIDKTGKQLFVPQYALNDVIISERDPGRPLVYELTVDDHVGEVQRSSGVLICTGTGSTAWMSNAAAVHADQVTKVLNDIGYQHTLGDARAIAERINMDLVFEGNSPEVEFYIREPLLPLSSNSVLRHGYAHRHGWAGRVSVRSLGWDSVISLDGIHLMNLPKGTTAVLQVGKRPGANLNVLSLAGSGEPFSRQ